MKVINISGRWIGQNHFPFVVAEMSGNHNQSLERVLRIVETAGRAGAHAVKLRQHWIPCWNSKHAYGDYSIAIR